MKRLAAIFSTVMLMAFTSSSGELGECSSYWMVEKGVTLEYKDYNAKNKLESTQLSTIKEITEAGGILTAVMNSTLKDDKDKIISENDYTFTCQDGEIKIDMRTMMDQKTLEGYEDMEVSIDQTNLVYPATFTDGQTLPDGKLTMKVSSGGVTIMTMVVEVTERKVETFETVTTPAGTFECVKISQVNNMNMGVMKMTTKSAVWFTKGIGLVKEESYDKNGVLESYRLLNQIIR